MLARLNSLVRSAAVCSLAIAIAIPAAAQNTQTDGRWQAWLGCWSPATDLVRVVGRSAPSVVCVLPASSATAVDIVTVSAGKIVDRSHVDTDGQPHAISKEGCTGSQVAHWSPSGRRVYLKSEYNCAGAPSTHVTAIFAMGGYGEWIDVQGIRVDKNNGVHAVRYREAADLGALPAEITSKLQPHKLARSAALLAVTETPSLKDVEEASKAVDPSVVSTWLIESDKASVQRPAPLSGKQLVELADNGVAPAVIDVMVGLSYPNVLTVNPVNYGVSRLDSDSAYMGYGALVASQYGNPLIGFDRFGFPIYASDATSLYGCSPFGYGPYDAGWNLYASRFGCGGYGYSYLGYPGYGYGLYGGYYGGYFGGGPVVIPSGPGSPAAPPHGRVVNGKGYSQGGSGPDGHATPRTDASPSSTSSGSGSGSSSSPPPPPPRTAQPRKP